MTDWIYFQSNWTAG